MKMKKVYVMLAIFLAFIMSSSTCVIAADLGATSVGVIGAESGSVSGTIIVDDGENPQPLLGGDPPEADFTYSSDDSYNYYFVDTSYDPDGGNIQDWEWNFNDEETVLGTPSTYYNFAHQAGNEVFVELNVQDDEGDWGSTYQIFEIEDDDAASIESEEIQGSSTPVVVNEEQISSTPVVINEEEISSQQSSSSTSSTSTMSATSSNDQISDDTEILSNTIINSNTGELIDSDTGSTNMGGDPCDLHIFDLSFPNDIKLGETFIVQFNVKCEENLYDEDDVWVVLTCDDFGSSWKVQDYPDFNPSIGNEISFTWPKLGRHTVKMEVYPNPPGDWYDADWEDNWELLTSGVKLVSQGVVSTGATSISGSASTGASSSYQSSSSSSPVSQSSYQSQATNYGSFSL